jgi:uncharacterized protein
MTERLSAPYTLKYAYTRSTGPVIGRFLDSLRDHVLEGIRAVDGRVLFPPTEYDEQGRETTGEFVTLRPTGTVTSFTWVNEPRGSHPLDRPFAWALIKLDGADTAMVHAVDAGKEKAMKIGMRVRVRWAEKATGTIRDIACFDPISPFIKTPVHLEFAVRPGEHQSQYLRALQEGRFVGGKCRATGKVYVPPRGATPESGLPTEDELVELPDTGVLTSFTIVRIPFEGQKLTPPYVFGAIVLDGADLPIYHLVSGVPYDEIRMGMRVKAKWKPRDQWGTSLENIEFFEPTGEPDAPFDSYSMHL